MGLTLYNLWELLGAPNNIAGAPNNYVNGQNCHCLKVLKINVSTFIRKKFFQMNIQKKVIPYEDTRVYF